MSHHDVDFTGTPAAVYGNGRFVLAASAGLIASSDPLPSTLYFAAQSAGEVALAAGGSVTFTVEAAGPAGLTLQWYAGPTGDTANPIAGANGPSYTTPALDASARYWVRATAGGATVDSRTFTALGPPAIVRQPQAAAAADHGVATFSVEAIGAGILS